jgi:hypothetical protein
MLIPTVGHVGMIAQGIMIAQHVLIKQQDTSLQQLDLIQWEDPSKIKNTLSGAGRIGSNKQIILKRKRLQQQQPQCNINTNNNNNNKYNILHDDTLEEYG